MTTNYRVRCSCGFDGLYRSREVAETLGRTHGNQPARVDDSTRQAAGIPHSWKVTEEPIRGK